MATFTYNDGLDHNLDDVPRTIATDAINITIPASGSLNTRLIINSEPQWGKKALPIGNYISIYAGKILIDGRDVRWFAYDGGSGNYPNVSLGANLKRSGVTLGEVIGIWTSFPSNNPAVYGSVNAGSAAAATGWIKVRSLSSAVADNDVLTIEDGTNTMNLTANGASKVGWLTLVGYETGAHMMCYAEGEPSVYGDWWELGTSNGTASQTFTHYGYDNVPCVWVEKVAGSAGADSDYEIWVNIGSAAFSKFKPGVAGKVFTQNASGVLTFGDGTTGGDIPPNGVKLRVPNIHFASTNATSWATQTRTFCAGGIYHGWRFETQSAYGTNRTLTIDTAMGDNFNIYAYRQQVEITDYASCGHLCAVSHETPSHLTRMGGGQHSNVAPAYGFFYAEGLKARPVLTDCTFNGSYRGSSLYSLYIRDALEGFQADRLTVYGPKPVVNTTTYPSVYIYQCSGNELTDLYIVGGQAQFLVDSGNTVINGVTLGDTTDGVDVANSRAGTLYFSNSPDCEVSGLKLVGSVSDCGSAAGLISCDTTSSCTLRDTGSRATPLDLKNRGEIAGTYSASSLRMHRVYWKNAKAAAGFNLNQYASSTRKIELISCYDENGKGLQQIGPRFKARGVRMSSVVGSDIIGASNSLVYTYTTSGTNQGTKPFDFFTSDTTGGVLFYGWPPLPDSAGFTATAGTPVTIGNGNVMLRTAGDEITFEMEYFAQGHTGFSATVPQVYGGTNIANLKAEYQIDTGSGWSAWKGMGASLNALSTTNLAAETLDPAVGFKLKVKIYCITTNSSNAFLSMAIRTVSTLAAQSAVSYVTDVFTATFDGILAGTEIRVYDSDDNEIAGVESCVADQAVSWAVPTNPTVTIHLISTTYEIIRFTYDTPSTVSSATIPVQQQTESFSAP